MGNQMVWWLRSYTHSKTDKDNRNILEIRYRLIISEVSNEHWMLVREWVNGRQSNTLKAKD